MRYTKPTILNDSKAASLIMSTQNKATDLPDNPAGKTDSTAYEADE